MTTVNHVDMTSFDKVEGVAYDGKGMVSFYFKDDSVMHVALGPQVADFLMNVIQDASYTGIEATPEGSWRALFVPNSRSPFADITFVVPEELK